MKNTGLIATACAAALASSAAVAQVKIYGLAHYSWDYVDAGNTPGVNSDDKDDVTGVDRESRLGFKGTEDLGDGLTAFWQVLMRVRANNGTPALRSTFVGLKGNWGSVLLGRNNSPYKMTTSGKVDIFVDRVGDYNNIFGRGSYTGAAFDGRQGQIVQYTSPKFNGLWASISRASTKFNEVGNNTEETEEWSGSVTYDSGPLYLAAGYEYHSGNNGPPTTVGRGTTLTTSADAWKIGGYYKFGSSRIGAIYESIDHDTKTSPFNRDAWLLNFMHKFGSNTFKVQYAAADDADKINDTGAENWSIGIDHAFSKRTAIYAMYTDMDNDSAARYGLRNYNNTSSSTAAQSFDYTPNAVGEDISAFSVGLIHKF